MRATHVDSPVAVVDARGWEDLILDPVLNKVGRVMADTDVQSVVVTCSDGTMVCYRAVVDDLTVLS
jgi:hypothetical protein